MNKLTRKVLAGASATAVAAATMVGLANADTINAGSDVEKVPGSTGTASIYINPGDPSDPVEACNADATHPVVVEVISNHPKVTIDAPGTVELTGCNSANAEAIGYAVAADAPVGAVATISATADAGTASDPNGLTDTRQVKISNGPPPVFADVTDYPTYVTDSFTVTVVAPEPVDPCAGRTAPAAAPTVTLDPSSPTGSNDWYKTTAPTFTVSPATNAEYSLDDGATWTSYSGAVTVPEGEHDITARNFLPASTSPACDRLDGPASTSQDVKVDTVNPTVEITSPADASSTLASSVDVSGTYSDATSGVATIDVNGGAASLDDGDFSKTGVALTCGDNTITATATDNAGNTAEDSVSVYRRCFTGSFLQPLDANGVLNKAKLGRVVPVKLTITANDGGSIPTPVYFGYRKISCTSTTGTDEVEMYAAGSSNVGNTFRLSDGAWIYNLDTSKLPGATVGTCYQLDVYVGGTADSSGIATGGVAIQNGSVKITLTK